MRSAMGDSVLGASGSGVTFGLLLLTACKGESKVSLDTAYEADCSAFDTGESCLGVYIDLPPDDPVGTRYREELNDFFILDIIRPRAEPPGACTPSDGIATTRAILDHGYSFSLSAGWICAVPWSYTELDDDIFVECGALGPLVYLEPGGVQSITVTVACTMGEDPDSND